MASPSNNTRQRSVFNPGDRPSFPAEQGPRMESDTSSYVLDAGFAEEVVRMASPSNSTRQRSLSKREDSPSFPTEQGPRMESDTFSYALDGQPGEISSSGASAKARSYGSESRGGSATGGPPGPDGSGYPPGGQPLQQDQEDSFWVCCGGAPSGCPRNGVWLRANTPACLECEHWVCPNCELKQTE